MNTIRVNTMEMLARMAVATSTITIIRRIETVVNITTKVTMSTIRDTTDSKATMVMNNMVIITSKDITKVIARVIGEGDNQIIMNKETMRNNTITDMVVENTQIIKIMIMDTRIYQVKNKTTKYNHPLNKQINYTIKECNNQILSIMFSRCQKMPKTHLDTKLFISQKIALSLNRLGKRHQIKKSQRISSNTSHLKRVLTTTIEEVAKTDTIEDPDMREVVDIKEMVKEVVASVLRKNKASEHVVKRIKMRIDINMMIDTIMDMRT